MNPDYYSDIKLAERFIFQSSIYLLNMFQKKIDSFITNKTRQSRERDRVELCHPQHIIDPDRKMEDPIKALSKDLTKPVWNCITKMEVVALCVKNNKHDHEKVRAMNDKFIRFLERFKHEHEDESNFRINLEIVDKSLKNEEFKEEVLVNPTIKKYWKILQDLPQFMAKIVNRYNEIIIKLQDKNESNPFLEDYITFCNAVLEPLIENEEIKELNTDLAAEFYTFSKTINEQIKAVIESSQGSTCINYWPNLGLLPELIHPMFLGIFLTIKDQYFQRQQKQRQNNPVSTSQNIEEQNQCIFEELQQRNCSKITFLNLDGYQSPFNIFISKYLSKYLQYISFPFEEDAPLKKQNYQDYYKNYSEFLVKQYVYSELTEEERQFQFKLFKTKEKSQKQLMQYYKKLFIFPIHSIYLTSRYDYKNIEFYQSKFIKFIMKELIYIQIKEFNPSVIIISYSNKLYLDPQFFEELMKELTIIGNMKLIFYNNLTKSYIYEQNLPNNLRFLQQYNHKYERRISLLNDNEINYNIFDKNSVFLKIASGTYTLDRTFEEDNVTEKYDIFRVQKYGGSLIKFIGKSHPVLQRYRNRCNEYLRLQRMLNSIYESERANEQKFYKNIPVYNQQLLQYTEQQLLKLINNQQFTQQTFVKYVSIQYFECQWKDFVLRYRLSIQRERQEQDYKYITKFIKQRTEEDENVDDFIAIEFSVEQNGISYLVNLNKNSQICMNPKQQGQDTLIYLFNHLVDHREGCLKNFYGLVDDSIEKMYETKVKLTEIELFDHNYQPIKLKPYQHFTKFNYFEMKTHVILFWPTLYDSSQALLCQFTHSTYSPKITNLIFIAAKTEPHRFISVNPVNESYQNIIPRSGCTCYQVPNTNLIYIFGGFYSNAEDYLNFQVDITLMKIGENIQVENAPKLFHFDYEATDPNHTDLHFRITKQSQDFIRPKIQYEVYEVDKSEDMENIKIFLLGGVGEKFMRPYSMIGYMAHQILFKKNGDLHQVRRIKLNNLVPVNMKKAVKTRSQMQLLAICGAQNRQIYTKKLILPSNSPTYTWFSNNYIREQEKMTYRKAIELGIMLESKQQRVQNIITIKENNSVATAKVVLRHYSSLKEVDNKVVLICQNEQHFIFNIELQLSDQVYVQFVNLNSKQIPLIGSNITAIDVYGLEIYAILRHKQYTNNNYVLVYADLSTSIQSLVDESVHKILLRQIYKFDDTIDHFTLKVLPQKKIAIIHSFPLHKSINYQQFLLKRTTKGPYIREKIYNEYQSYNINNFLDEKIYRSTPVAFYYTAKNTVISWTFKSNRRSLGQEEYFFLIQQLNCKEEFKKWKLKAEKMINFQKMFITNEEANHFITTILDIKVTSQKKYEIFVLQNDLIYVGNFDVHLSQTNNIVTLRQYDKSIGEYEIQKFRHKYNVQFLQKLTKYGSRYDDNMEEMELQA